jgi:3'-phosphoadenosine 5'-phosphosulfate sulfotransferase (PAPS reductase)/FAD synthetase
VRRLAEEVVAEAVERFHPRLVLACSFQKEESVLIDMLLKQAPDARVFTIDTGVLFPETYAVWKKVEDRYGLKVEVYDASNPERPWTGGDHCCGVQKVAALENALSNDVDAWITGIRREQAPTRANAQHVERDEKRGIWTSGTTSPSTTSPITRCTTRATSQSAAPPARSLGPGVKVAGQALTRSSAGSTLPRSTWTR